jgi:V8-like Glu-specific endopeptidase
LATATAVVLLAVFVIAPAAGRAASPTVHVLEVGGAHLDAAEYRVDARPPVPRFRILEGAEARASSVRVDSSSDLSLRTNGKIIGFDPHEGRYSCSGTAINTPSHSMVLTAGHCAVEHRSEGRRIVFVPAYDHGSRPFGTFNVEAVYVVRQWRQSENPDFDVAALQVSPNGYGELTDVVGARGFRVSRSREAAFQVFGYPAAALQGEELRSCRTRGLGSDPLTFGFAGPPTMPTTCDMAAGASGGAWVINGQYINGVTSYSYAGRPTRLYSPYFGPEIGAFLKQLP